jgi:hypothetical protein
MGLCRSASFCCLLIFPVTGDDEVSTTVTMLAVDVRLSWLLFGSFRVSVRGEHDRWWMSEECPNPHCMIPFAHAVPYQ